MDQKSKTLPIILIILLVSGILLHRDCRQRADWWALVNRKNQ